MRQGGFHRTGRDGALFIYLPNTKTETATGLPDSAGTGHAAPRS